MPCADLNVVLGRTTIVSHVNFGTLSILPLSDSFATVQASANFCSLILDFSHNGLVSFGSRPTTIMHSRKVDSTVKSKVHNKSNKCVNIPTARGKDYCKTSREIPLRTDLDRCAHWDERENLINLFVRHRNTPQRPVKEPVAGSDPPLAVR